MPERLRIFISSPGDVTEERLRAHLVIQKLARDYARYFQIEAYLWEHEPMLASGHFQDAIEPPSACDVVVLIVYSRLGTELPERSGAARISRHRRPRARSPARNGNIEEALAASRERGAPDLLAYRKLGDPGASLADAGAARRAGAAVECARGLLAPPLRGCRHVHRRLREIRDARRVRPEARSRSDRADRAQDQGAEDVGHGRGGGRLVPRQSLSGPCLLRFRARFDLLRPRRADQECGHPAAARGGARHGVPLHCRRQRLGKILAGAGRRRPGAGRAEGGSRRRALAPRRHPAGRRRRRSGARRSRRR